MDCIRAAIAGIVLHAEQKVRRHQDRPQSHADSKIEAATAPALVIKRHQWLQIVAAEGPPISPVSQCRDNLCRAGGLLSGSCGFANEDLVPTGRLTHTCNVI